MLPLFCPPKVNTAFKKEISKKLDNPIFLPRILTIEQFIIEIANIEVIDNLVLLLSFLRYLVSLMIKRNLMNFMTGHRFY